MMMNIFFCKMQQLQLSSDFDPTISKTNTNTRKEMKFPVVLFLCTVISVQVRELTTSNNNVVDHDDHIALLAFKSTIKHDPHGVLTSWNTSTHFCEWQGVTCGRKHKRVTILDLQSRGLVGTLSPYIGNLSFLKEIRLFNNTLQGKLPPEIGHLFRLEILDLRFNSHEGEIPGNLFRCSNLVALRLGANNFVGKIPNRLDSLSKLKYLEFALNNFTGGIPYSIGNLTSLEFLYVTDNKFGGTIPDIFHRLTNLIQLGVGSNELIYGTIPPSLYNLSRLTKLSLSETQLHGNLPLNFGLLFPKLQFLQIRDCHFSGPIPSSLSNATELSNLEMGNNNFSGKVSVDFRDMKYIQTVFIRNNNLGTGRADDLDFLVSLLNCRQLDYVSVSLNNFGGALLDSIRNISTPIRVLSMASNRIHGHIPSWIGTLKNLEILGMSGNQFTGQIPESFGQLRKLNRIDLNTNRLSGKIPASLGNIISMSHLSLYGNKLNGTVPPSLGNCKNLDYLYIHQNNLSGNIPKEIFEIAPLISIYLSQNHFIGILPSEVGGLKHLTQLMLFDNELSGSIPDSLGGCDSLLYLRMRNNFFNGSIPRGLSSLRGVKEIDLSHNSLSGEIPKYLETFALTYLNLSFNDFEGEIPTKGIFTNTSVLSLQGNKRLCGGVLGLKFPACIVKEPTPRRTMSSQTIVIITIVSSLLGVILFSSPFIYFRFKRKQKVKTSEYEKTLINVSYGMLYKATDGFSTENLLGSGSFGSVFKGILDPNEQIVAVKVVKLQRRGALKSFTAECEALRNVRHRNIMKIITSCSSVDYQGNDFKALVYEFMPKGNLDAWLHQVRESTTNGKLNLLQRLNILIDVASSIDYLHHYCHLPIIHCDLKPSNILLDDGMVAHVGDFGIAKFLQELSNPNQISSTGIRGTIGYAPPEYGIGSAVSTRGDVYSFGIVLLEMITEKRPTDGMFEGGLNLHNFARIALSGHHLMDILDPVLLSNEAETERSSRNSNVVQARDGDARDKCLISMVNIGIACSMEAPQDRMDIVAAVRELLLARDVLQQKSIVRNRGRNV